MVSWPAWASWVVLLAVIITLIIVWMLMNTIADMREALAQAGIGRSAVPARNRGELEELYKKGAINRDAYERWKARLQ